MNNRLISRKLVFLISTEYQGRDLGLLWTITQAIPAPYRQREEDSIYNQVQRHLHELSTRLGFDYRIRFWGYPEMLDEYIEFHEIEVY